MRLMMFFMIPPVRSLANVEVFGILNFAQKAISSVSGQRLGKNSCLNAPQARSAVNPLLTKKHGIAFVFQRHRQGPNDIVPVSCGIMRAWGEGHNGFLN